MVDIINTLYRTSEQGDRTDTFHLSRALLMLPLIFGLSLLGLGSMRPKRFGPVILRSVLITLAMLFYFASLAVMPIAQELAGLFTSPIFVLLISALAMKQRIGPWRIVAVLLGFAGILCVLQLDPYDFVPLSKTGAELLFELISQRYERGSALITSNLPFEEWTETFGTERLTGALLDRLTHHVNILEMNGESYCLNQSKSRIVKSKEI